MPPILHVQEHVAVTIGGEVLGSAAEIHRGRRDLARRRVDRGHTLAAAIRAEDPLRRRIVGDAVGVVSDPHLVDHRQRFQIEDRDGAGIRCADKSVANITSHSDAVQALLTGDLTDGRAGIEIEHDDLDTVRHVQPPAVGIGGDVVPAGVTRNGNPLDDMIRPGGHCDTDERNQRTREAGDLTTDATRPHVTFLVSAMLFRYEVLLARHASRSRRPESPRATAAPTRRASR